MHLVTESSSLVRSGRSRSSVADVELSVLPTSDSEEESEDVLIRGGKSEQQPSREAIASTDRLLSLVKLGDVFVGTHLLLFQHGERRDATEEERRKIGFG